MTTDLTAIDFGDDNQTLAVIDAAAFVAPIEGIDETATIAETAPLKIEWDKHTGTWKSDLGESETLTVTQFAARRVWAKWSNVVGQPEAMGWGEAPPDCDSGYAVVMDSQEFGVVTGMFFGITSRIISAAAKVYTRTGEVNFSGKVVVKTKFGTLFNPVIK